MIFNGGLPCNLYFLEWYTSIFVGEMFPLTTARDNKLAQDFLIITRQPLQLESCSNPLRMRQIFLVLLKKRFFDLGEGFAWERLAKWGCFGIFDQL